VPCALQDGVIARKKISDVFLQPKHIEVSLLVWLESRIICCCVFYILLLCRVGGGSNLMELEDEIKSHCHRRNDKATNGSGKGQNGSRSLFYWRRAEMVVGKRQMIQETDFPNERIRLKWPFFWLSLHIQQYSWLLISTKLWRNITCVFEKWKGYWVCEVTSTKDDFDSVSVCVLTPRVDENISLNEEGFVNFTIQAR
jgi:hypothetical protein